MTLDRNAEKQEVPVNPETGKPYINTLAAVAISPAGASPEKSTYVAQAVDVIRESGLPNETNAMFTNIEGDIDDVLKVIRDATMKLAGQGYRTDVVEYERGERFAGESKYPLKKMLSFAMEGVTSLSVKPLRMITGLGFLIFLVSLVMIVYNLARWAMGATVTGWASLACSLWALGGLILLAMGVVGEYVGKIYLETKGRPRFLIRQVLEDSDEEETA